MTNPAAVSTLEATQLPWFVDQKGIDTLIRGADGVIVAKRHRLPGVQHEANFALIETAVNSFDGLKQRVKVLEEALESPHSRAHREKALELANKERVRYRVALLQITGMANLMFAECDDAEEIIRIAKEALDLQCGNCGDDGEEPLSNCPTCHGTGFKALAPPVGEKDK